MDRKAVFTTLKKVTKPLILFLFIWALGTSVAAIVFYHQLKSTNQYLRELVEYQFKYKVCVANESDVEALKVRVRADKPLLQNSRLHPICTKFPASTQNLTED